MGAALPFVAAGSAVLGAISSIKQGNAEAAAANYNAQVSANNAAIANKNAEYAGAEGEAAVQQQQLKTRAEVGAIKANQAAAGVDVNQGSPVDVRSSAAELGELNAITVRSNAARQAYGYQTEAASDLGQAALDKSQASNDKSAGYINAGTTLLGGASKVNDSYNSFIGSKGIGSGDSAPLSDDDVFSGAGMLPE